MICAKSGWNWSSGFGEEVENVKVYRQTDGQTDWQRAIRKAHLSFQLRWAKKEDFITWHTNHLINTQFVSIPTCALCKTNKLNIQIWKICQFKFSKGFCRSKILGRKVCLTKKFEIWVISRFLLH
jgi:hypothetical protein